MRTENPLRELIKSGKPTIATHVHTLWGGMAEVIGHTGVIDYIEFVSQYAPYDLFSLENFGRAIDLFPHMSAMMKLDQEPRTYLAQRAVGAGIPNMLFADIRSVEDAKESVSAMKPDTPSARGTKGVSDSRNVGYVLPSITMADQVRLYEEGVVAIMVEKRSAVENLDQILAVPGIDMVQFGPGDYSVNIGVPGQTDHHEVQLAERRTIETALTLGIRPRAEIQDWRDAERYTEMGVKDFAIGSDLETIYNFFQDHGSKLVEFLGRDHPGGGKPLTAASHAR